MSIPVVVVDSGGLAITEDANGLPMTVAETGYGIAVTIVDSGGLAVALEGNGGLVTLSATTVAEDATSGTAIGTLSVSNGSGSYTFTITADPDSKFAINGDGVTLETAAALDYETATSHSVTISADNGVDDPISRTFTITVTDVAEGGAGTDDDDYTAWLSAA